MTFRPLVPFSRRKLASQAVSAALEAFKRAGLRYGFESSGGSHPLEAGALLRLAAKALYAAEVEYSNALIAETQEQYHVEID